MSRVRRETDIPIHFHDSVGFDKVHALREATESCLFDIIHLVLTVIESLSNRPRGNEDTCQSIPNCCLSSERVAGAAGEDHIFQKAAGCLWTLGISLL
jgi:hypothetical protein